MKRFLAAFAAVFVMMSFAGCSVHKIVEPIKEDKFRSVSEERGLTVEAKTGESSTSYNVSCDKYGAQFYVFKAASSCDASFNYIIGLLAPADSEGNQPEITKTEKPYKKCTVVNEKEYNILIQIDNTLFYGYTVDGADKKDLEDFVKALGYK